MSTPTAMIYYCSSCGLAGYLDGFPVNFVASRDPNEILYRTRGGEITCGYCLTRVRSHRLPDFLLATARKALEDGDEVYAMEMASRLHGWLLLGGELPEPWKRRNRRVLGHGFDPGLVHEAFVDSVEEGNSRPAMLAFRQLDSWVSAGGVLPTPWSQH